MNNYNNYYFIKTERFELFLLLHVLILILQDFFFHWITLTLSSSIFKLIFTPHVFTLSWIKSVWNSDI